MTMTHASDIKSNKSKNVMGKKSEVPQTVGSSSSSSSSKLYSTYNQSYDKQEYDPFVFFFSLSFLDSKGHG